MSSSEQAHGLQSLLKGDTTSPPTDITKGPSRSLASPQAPFDQVLSVFMLRFQPLRLHPSITPHPSTPVFQAQTNKKASPPLLYGK